MHLPRFADLEDLDDVVLARLLADARGLEQRPLREDLRGRILALLFLDPSLRTLASFQAGMAQLGGTSIVLTPGQSSWQLETRHGAVMDQGAQEHVREAIPVLERYADAIGVRAFARAKDLETDLAEPIIRPMMEAASKPFINLESAFNHPCQALADWKTLDDHEIPTRGGKFVLSWAWHPRALPMAVPSAAAAMAARRGMELVILRPDGYSLPEPIMRKVKAAAARSGGSVRETTHREDALDGAHALYAKSWGSAQAYGDTEAELEGRAGLRGWCVRNSWFANADPSAIFMHCLPVRRNVVVADEVLDSPRSRVVQQAGNRLHVQKAVLLEMLAGDRP